MASPLLKEKQQPANGIPHKLAVVFITKLEGGVQKNEGLCLKCARELHIKPVDDMIEKMGISDEDLDNLSGEMMNALNGVESLMDMSIDPDNDANDDSDDDGRGYERGK